VTTSLVSRSATLSVPAAESPASVSARVAPELSSPPTVIAGASLVPVIVTVTSRESLAL